MLKNTNDVSERTRLNEHQGGILTRGEARRGLEHNLRRAAARPKHELSSTRLSAGILRTDVGLVIGGRRLN